MKKIWIPLALLAALTALLLWLGLRQEPSPQAPTAPAQASQDPQAPQDALPWNLPLVNPWNPLPPDWDLQLEEIENGHQVDARCADALRAMLADCRAAGLDPLICSSYRTQEKQTALYNNLVNKLLARGLSQAETETQAAAQVARPGTSEHQLGLAVDIVDRSHQVLDASQENTPVQQWLMEHCWDYGFLLRYPSDKRDITGIIYEPWHYRYVGVEAAQAIRDRGLCLEEFLGT